FYALYISHSFILLTPRPPISTLFPYTTLFRSLQTRRVYRKNHFYIRRALTVKIGQASSSPIHLIAILTDLMALSSVPIVLCEPIDRKSTRLNSSHVKISYAVFCLKKKKKYKT